MILSSRCSPSHDSAREEGSRPCFIHPCHFFTLCAPQAMLPLYLHLTFFHRGVFVVVTHYSFSACCPSVLLFFFSTFWVNIHAAALLSNIQYCEKKICFVCFKKWRFTEAAANASFSLPLFSACNLFLQKMNWFCHYSHSCTCAHTAQALFS